MSEKPIIRHCRNCEYSYSRLCGECGCQVRYTTIDFPRIKACICRFYKQRESKIQKGI